MAQSPATGVADEITTSWRRSTMSGLTPSTCVPSVGEVDLGTPLLTGARPVMTELESDLRGTKYSTLLVDRDCRVVHRWCDDPRAEDGFDALDVKLGASLLEDSIGTNALGTAFAARRAVTVNGREHFAESLRAYSCYGHPIRNPLTRRFEGVLDISVLAPTANPLLRALISRAAREIELRLLEGSRVSDRHLMLAFQSTKTNKPVVAIRGDDIVLTNRQARDLFSAADIALLQILVNDVGNDHRSLRLQLESGADVVVDVERVVGADRGAIIRLATPKPARRAKATPFAPHAPSGAPHLVTGPPGTGRTSRARELAATRPSYKNLSPSLTSVEDGAEWARRFTTALSCDDGTVVIDGIDLLPDELIGFVLDRLSSPRHPELILTSGPLAGLSGRAAALAASAMTSEELVPLAARRHDIPSLAKHMLRELEPAGRLHLAPSLLHLLAQQPWPGNLHELRSVVGALAVSRSVGALTMTDLPARYQQSQQIVNLNARDMAERDVIIGVLHEVDGNKVKAAEKLCMSRTTLYARMRRLKITTF